MKELTALPQLEFDEAISAAWKKLAQFNGRSRRSEYWWTKLAVVVLNLVFMWMPLLGFVINAMLNLALIPIEFRRLHDTGRSGWWYGVNLIGAFVYAVTYVVLMEFAIWQSDNYVHTSSYDAFSINASIWLILGLLIGIIYNIVYIVLLCQDSQEEENKYGPSPKYVEKDTEEETPETQSVQSAASPGIKTGTIPQEPICNKI